MYVIYDNTKGAFIYVFIFAEYERDEMDQVDVQEESTDEGPKAMSLAGQKIHRFCATMWLYIRSEQKLKGPQQRTGILLVGHIWNSLQNRKRVDSLQNWKRVDSLQQLPAGGYFFFLRNA